MTTSSLRIVAAGIAIIFAVLTGLFTGMVGGQVCTAAEQPSQPSTGEQKNDKSGRRGGGVPQNPDNTTDPGDPQQPGAQDPEQPGSDPDQPDGDPDQPNPGGGMPGSPARGGDGSLDAAEVQSMSLVISPALPREAASTAPPPKAAPAVASCEGSFSAPAGVVGSLGVLLASGAVTALLFLRRRDQAPPFLAATDPIGNPQQAEQVAGERSTLIQACIYVRDRASSKALADRLGWALQEVGVTTVSPNGVRFDPAHHEAGGSAATSEPAQAGVIAAVEVPGYVDRGVVLRPPVVTVYRKEPR